ncbi:MAG: hypothetical protein ACREHG_01940 [Candidatus Saccharimonadales bacterium]
MKKIEILSKADQIDAILEDRLEQALREKIPDLTAYDLLRSLTFTRKDLVEHLRRNLRATNKYFDMHEGAEPPPGTQIEVLHDVPVMMRESSGEYRVGWMDRGVMTDARRFNDLSEAVAHYIMLSAGMD